MHKRQNLNQIEPAVLSVDEATRYLGICRATIYGAFNAGELKRTKIGRRTVIHRKDADAFLERCRAETA